MSSVVILVTLVASAVLQHVVAAELPGHCEETAEASQSTVLMQFNVKQQRLRDPESSQDTKSKEHAEEVADEEVAENEHASNDQVAKRAPESSQDTKSQEVAEQAAEHEDARNNKEVAKKPRLSRDSALYRLLRKAQENAQASGQPFEYLLDVDYLHDANNPLDNDMKESLHSLEPSPTSRPAEHHTSHSTDHDTSSHTVDRKRSTSTSSQKEVSHLNCVTRAEPRATSTAMTDIAKPGTACVFGADERDEGSHCIMEGGSYGSYGWCYTTKAGSEWGSCSEQCPLSGSAGLLERRISSMDGLVSKILAKIRTKKDCFKEKIDKQNSALLTKTPLTSEVHDVVLSSRHKEHTVIPIGPNIVETAETGVEIEQAASSGAGRTLTKQKASSSSRLASLLKQGLISDEEFQALSMENQSLEQN